MTVAAVIVSFFPNQTDVKHLINLLITQVEHVYVVDNTPIETGAQLILDEVLRHNTKVSVISPGENIGIAAAHNLGLKAAIQQAHDHAIIFDQDSVPPSDIVTSLLAEEAKLLRNGIKVASVGPLYYDYKSGAYSPAIRSNGLWITRFPVDHRGPDVVQSDHLISSGTLLRLNILESIGYMDEKLFIDWVDVEWGLRAGKHGYCHYICKNVIMKHSIGDNNKKVFYKNISVHSNIRKYYIVRNATYLIIYGNFSLQWRIRMVVRLPIYIVFHSLFAAPQSKTTCFKIMVLGARDGINSRLGRKEL